MEKKYDHLAAEKQARELWEKEKTYAVKNGSGPLYSVDTPPPTVSGKLHIGHIFSYTQTDIIARYKRMTGHTVFYPFGFDDNGLPTERFVEKQRGITPAQVGRSEFIKACLEETETVEKQFEDLWRKVGLSVDWDMCYSTISDETRKISQASFLDLYKKGFIYRKEEPALYCTAFRTSVAQADLEDVEKETIFNDVAFSTEDGDEIIIGTTRPELLASCVAMFYNPEDARYQHLAGKQAIVPIYGNKVPILADDKAQVDKGTGLVMCCTFGDKTDIEWWKKHNLPYRQSVGFDGRWLEGTGPLSGLKVKQAREKILELLKEAGVLRNQKTVSHVVSVYERSKKEIEYVMLSQWFLKILPHKEKLVALAEEINWYPSFMKARYIDWVKNLQWDWCLSRQRYFGIPFPVWYDKKTGAVVVPDEKDLPIDPQEQEFPGRLNAGQEVVPDTDVMDTWNTSSLTPYVCRELFVEKAGGKKENFLPMGMRPQAHDIIRTWAFYTIVKSWMHDGIIPWKDIVISGHVLSTGKEKISKSRGNEPLVPETLLEHYPADAVRYWTASGSLGHDVAFSENTLKIGQKLLVKLWNACRFACDHLQDFDPREHQVRNFGTVNEWILYRLHQAHEQYDRYFAKHEIGLALGAVEHYFWHDLCDNYLELIKKQLFAPQEYSEQEVRATKATLYQVLLRVLQLYAPYLPHITETIYQQMFKKYKTLGDVGNSLHQTVFAPVKITQDYEQSAHQVTHLLAAVAGVRKLKSDHSISLKTEINDCVIVAEQSVLEQIKPLEMIFKGVANAKTVGYTTETAGTSTLQEQDGLWHATVCIK